MSRGYRSITNATGVLYDSDSTTQWLWNMTEQLNSSKASAVPASEAALICLALLHCTIELVGIVGNFLVIYVILSDRKMRRSVTNLFIMNLGIADCTILILDIPEIVQFIMNGGWVLGPVLCKIQRFVMVFCLYASIMTLLSVCVERYIAIVHPIKAHIWCSRRRILVAIVVIWTLAVVCGLPTVIFNTVYFNDKIGVSICVIYFPEPRALYYAVYKFLEFFLFFFGPVLIQIVLYTIVGKQLFVGTDKLHRKQAIKESDGAHKERDSDAIRARKGVVKMLIASVSVYFISYAPVQVPLFYRLILQQPFKQNWSFHVLVLTMSFINSAVNPVLYSIFSQNFRRHFARHLCYVFNRKRYLGYHRSTPSASTKNSTKFVTGRTTDDTMISEM